MIFRPILIAWPTLIGAVLIGAGLAAASPASAGGFPDGAVERGAYLARMSGCIACHTDTEAKGAPVAGGAPLETPFGTFYPPNISTHAEDGIGAWTVADFARAVREGLAPDDRPYYPAFPYPHYAGFSDQDIADLWAAFQTVPATPGGRRAHDLGFPWSVRQGLWVWRALNFDRTAFPADPDRSDDWNRGAFIVNTAAHCGACHTPRGPLGGRDVDRRFQGASLGEETVPAITVEALRRAGWDRDSLALSLRTGITPEGDVFGGRMAEVVREGTAWLDDDDLRAVAAYLMD